MTVALEHAPCSTCGRDTAHLRRDMHHAFHLLAALSTMGVWAIVWIARALMLDRTWYCVSCGSARMYYAAARRDRAEPPREAEVEP